MNFGYVSGSALDGLNLALPPDPSQNAELLSAHPRQGPPKLWIGCAEYRVPEWKGVLYPARTAEAAMLSMYSMQFSCLEMNGTHYRIYPPEHVARWTARIQNPNFRFLPKFPRDISHAAQDFQALEELTLAFLQSVDAFQPYLGPLFLQMSERFSPAGRQAFFRYLATLPEGYTYFVELRHPGWFSDPAVSSELFAALQAMGLGAVITDTPGRRDVLHMRLSVPKVMVRFVSTFHHPSYVSRSQQWLERLRYWMDLGLHEASFIVHTGLSAPRAAQDIIVRANEVLPVQLRVPVLGAGELPFG